MKPFHLFERFGVELEYMIVDAASLNVRPMADKLVHAIGTARKNEVRHGKLRWSNELVLHVIELKTDGPARRLEGLAKEFQHEVRFLNGMLSDYAATLLPTGMHPWMDPFKETRLWPHGDRTIYEAFHRIFDCRGHGWANLQSTHLNLPFANDTEFRKLHSAVRLVLPLLPALAASSPFTEGRRAAKLDMRLEAYRLNCARIPSMTGRIVPERVHSRDAYERKILGRIYSDLEPHDPEGILREEWVNARGAIARFERNTIEIRVLDIQECPEADLAIVQFIVAVLRALVSEKLSPLKAQEDVSVVDLEDVLLGTMATAEDTVIQCEPYLASFGLSSSRPHTAGDVLSHLLDAVTSRSTTWRPVIEFILRKGCLSRRLRRAVGRNLSREKLEQVYGKLAECLQQGELFDR